MDRPDSAVIGWAPEGDAERQAIREQLERILAHPLFRNSKRYPSLLRYVVESTLEGHADRLKERTLGVEVFGRDPDYDTNLDHVVRTTAGEIRRRLAQYYYELEEESEVRIDLPSGSYVPEFRTAAEKLRRDPIVLPVAAPVRRRWPAYLAFAAGATLLAVLAWLYPWPPRNAMDRFWGPVLDSSGSVLLCLAPANSPDQAAAVPRNAALAGEAGGPEPGLALRDLQRMETQHVALSDATTISRLTGLLEARGSAYHIRSGASITLTDLRDGPAVLVGAFNNGWTMRLTGPMRFRFEMDHDTHKAWIKDQQNPARQDWVVDLAAPYLRLTEDYAMISRALDPMTDRVVVIAGGIGIFGTMAAGEFLTNPRYMEALVKQAPGNWWQKNIQAVLATKVINGNSGPPRVVATYFW